MNPISYRPVTVFQMAFLGCLLVFQSAAAFGQVQCEEAFSSFRIPMALQSAQKAWASRAFTSPREHRDERFQYLVHAGPNVTNDGADPVISFMSHVVRHDFNSDGFFSTSLVSERHTGTFSLSGVILQVPFEKIIAATPEDMRSTDADKLTLARGVARFAKRSLQTPDEILASASGDTGFFRSDLSWTEVLINGRAPARRQIKIAGVFTHRDSLGRPILSEARVRALQEASWQMNVPLIFLPPPQGSFVLKVRMSGNREPQNREFMTDYGPARIQFFATQNEVRAVFEAARKSGALVRLVDETGGPVAALADDSIFSGGWIDRYRKNEMRYVSLPSDSPAIEILYEMSPR